MSAVLEALRAQGAAFTALTTDSRRVQPGTLFLACPGTRLDGRDFIAQAVAQGAAAVLWEAADFSWNPAWRLPNLAVTGLRDQCGPIAAAFYGHPSRKLWMIGVTGTNGKTSCSHWLAQSLTLLGRRTALIGTLGNGFPGALTAATHTTPDPVALHALLHDYLQQGAQGVVMEVSSHALTQGRVNGVEFDLALLTNLTRDHLDYHGDMAAYGAAKQRLFEWEGLGCAILNADDAFGARLADTLAARHRPVLTYGFSENAMVRGSALTLDNDGLTMTVTTPQGSAALGAALLGRFNGYNLLAVLSVLLCCRVELAAATAVLAQLAPVAGRMERHGGGTQPLVVIDYAHTPDALENVLATLRGQTHGRLYCVFGCGGDRDRGKRPLMGAVATRLADHVIVTSDNPRGEVPQDIMHAICAGLPREPQQIADRAQAIHAAVRQAAAGDIVLVAGKGHEDYQEIAGVRHPFSDAAVVRAALEGWTS